MSAGNKTRIPLTTTYNIITLILLNAIFFICNYFPKHILEFASVYSFIAIFLNLIFYILFFSIIIIIFDKNKCVFSNDIYNPFEAISKRFAIKKLCLLIVAQIIIDILSFIFNIFFAEKSCVLVTILTFANWILIYVIATDKSNNLFKRKKLLAFILVFSILFLLICFFVDFKVIELYSDSIYKYKIESATLKSIIINLDFILQIKNFLFDTILGVMLLVIHNFKTNNQATPNENCDNRKERKIFDFLIRFIALLLSAIILITAKIIILPHSSKRGFESLSSTTEKYVSDNEFYISTNTISITSNNSHKEKLNIYEKTKIEILFNGTKINELKIDGFYKAHTADIKGNQMTITDNFIEHNINGHSVSVLEDLAICYVKDKLPMVVLFNDINSHSEDSFLTETIKTLVSNGDVVLFVNSYEYLQKYDKTFYLKTIERYKNQSFTNIEQNKINEIGYNVEYLSSIHS